MPVSKPDWWFDGESQPKKKSTIYDQSNSFHQADTLYKEFGEHSDIPPKKHKKKSSLSKFEKSDNQTIKELTRLLINKTQSVDDLQARAILLEDVNKRLELELKQYKTEHSNLYNEICILRKLIGDLDLDKPKVQNNSCAIFLDENAPQEIVDVVWKALSKIYHPDCGGSEEKMKMINLARDEFYQINNWK